MNELWFDKIDAYLDGKMSPEEQSGFESELSANEELASAVHIYRTIEIEMRSQQKNKASEASLRQTLEEAGLRHFNGEPADTSEAIAGGPGTIIKIPSRTILAAAAAVLVILALGGILYFITERNRTKMVARKDHPDTEKRDNDAGALVKSPDKLLKQQDMPAGIPVKDSSLPAQKVSAATNKTRLISSQAEQERLFVMDFHLDKAPEGKGDLEDELRLYEGGNYREAITALEGAKSYRGNNDNDLEAFYNSYYLALSYMADHRVEKAIPELESALKESRDGFKRSKAQWYLALAYLKKGEWRKADKLLNEVAGSKQAGEYKDKAVKLVKHLTKYK